ncbi:hypothetical protein O0L34_g3977 [Tuta absoluta]|nr:hypothetical protein O0L34_g3977 [Tuta absoluta]
MGRVLWWGVCAALVAATAAQTPVTLPEWLSGQFSQRGFSGIWISDTEFTYTVADPADKGIYVFDVPSLEGRVLVSNDLMEFLNTSNPILSADREYILASSEVEQVYRHSRTALYTLYNINSTEIVRIADHQRLQLCIFGGGHSLAYVLDNNVYYLPENSSQAIQLTFDGVPGVVYNGHTDWVYEEDVMSTGRATWFSTDGSYLAFASFDDTEVDTYSYYHWVDKQDPDDLYPELKNLKYPKVGRKNPDVRLRVVDLNALTSTGNVTFVEIPAPEEVSADHVLGGVTWPTADELAVHWLNRRQNFSVFRIYKIANGSIASFEQEIREAPNGWVPIALPKFGRDGDFYISPRWSERQTDGIIWQHLVISQRLNGAIVSTSITPGFYTVNNFIGMNEDLVAYYYTRTVPGQPWRSQVHVAGARDGCVSCNIQMPDGGQCSWVAATASLGGRYLTITCSSIDEPSAVFIVDPWNTTVLYTWEDNGQVRQNLTDKQRPTSLIFNVPLENGFPAPVRLHLPPGLDMNDTNTKYPLIFNVYSGPGTNAVTENFAVGYHTYMATSRNIIYMQADGRGSGLKGQDMLFALNNALGSVEIEDHFVILREVLDRYQFIDRARVGIWGHSYGGYATLLTLLRDDDHVFACGVSGAPVTSWLYYNSMYTERYMGLPTPEDNLAGYEAGDVTLLAEKLRGHDFFIFHGNADDNVHYQNAAKLYKALADLNIPFEQMSYPDEAHSLVGVNPHRYNYMDQYWTRCLKL